MQKGLALTVIPLVDSGRIYSGPLICDRTATVGWASRAVARVAGDDAPAAEAHRRWPNSALRGSNRPGFGSMIDYAACVIHLWPVRG